MLAQDEKASGLSQVADPRFPSAAARGSRPPLRVLMTVNAAWNIWNFRRGLVAALLEDGHR